MINIDKDLCVGCGACVSDCFPGALTISGGLPALTSPDACIGCGHCAAVCPQGAVSVDGQDGSEPLPGGLPAIDPDRLLLFMKARRSIRHFKPAPVEESKLAKIIEAGRFCPTARNLQATGFIIATGGSIDVLRGHALRVLASVGAELVRSPDPGWQRRGKNFIDWYERYQSDAGFDPLFFGAPLVIIVTAPKEAARDACAASSYMELMAEAQGLGVLFSGYFTSTCTDGALREYLGLGSGLTAARALVVGYPDVGFERTAPRKPADCRRL